MIFDIDQFIRRVSGASIYLREGLFGASCNEGHFHFYHYLIFRSFLMRIRIIQPTESTNLLYVLQSGQILVRLG